MKEQRELLNIYTILNNLSSAVQVLHGITKGGFVPVFCNKYYTSLTGFTLDEFIENKRIDLFFDFHKDDIDEMIKVFDIAYEKNESFTFTHRLLTKNGTYIYVSNFCSFSLNDDGTKTLYSVMSNSDEIKTLQLLMNDRYSKLEQKLNDYQDSKDSTILFNLSKNSYEVLQNKIPFQFPLNSKGDYQDFFNSVVNNIEYNSRKQDFITRFSKKHLLEELYNTNDIYIDLPIKLKNKIINWYCLEINLFVNPRTCDVEACVSFKDIDHSFRTQKSMERIYNFGYEVVAHIDLNTGLLSFIKADEVLSPNMGKVLDYESHIESFIDKYFIVEYKEEAYDAFRLATICNNLKRTPTYALTYPILNHEGKETICQWRMGFLEGQTRILLLTRNNLSKYLDETIDSLTGLNNQVGFKMMVSKTLAISKDRQYQIIRLDFDGFKLINDEYGYEGGNHLLRRFARDFKRHLETFTTEITYARFEADHFLLFSPVDGLSPERIYNELDKILSNYPEYSLITIRMGVYPIFEHKMDVLAMCDRALLALQSIKGNFDKHIEYYNTELRNKVVFEQFLTSIMEEAIETEQFEIWLQPQINHDDKKLIGAEALVRWNHPQKGYIMPNDFIGLFEKNGFIYELDKYVLEKVCKFQRYLLDNNLLCVPISVNFSRYDLLKIDFFDKIDSIIKKYDLPKSLIHLEITESAFSESTGLIFKVVNKLIDNDFIIAIDDFGSGYSSLSMLQSMQAHILKLDMKFFKKSDNEKRNYYIVESMIKMANLLQMSVIAEGVEDKVQADFLSNAGCKIIQGYLYSKPLKIDDFLLYMKNTYCEMHEVAKNSKHNSINELQELSKLYVNILNNTNYSVIITDATTLEVIFANEIAEKSFKKLFDSRLKLKCHQYIKSSQLKCESCPLDKLSDGKLDYTEIENGTTYHYIIYRTTLKNRDVFVTLREKVCSNTSDDEYDIIENIPGAIALFKQVGQTAVKRIFISNKAQEILEMKVHPTKETPLEESLKMIYEDDIPKLKTAIIKSLKTKSGLREEFRVYRANLQPKWIEVTTNPVLDNDGKLLFYTIFTDISDIKERESKELQLSKKRYDIYQKMISEVSDNTNEDLLEKIELNLTTNTVNQAYINQNENKYYAENEVNTLLFAIAQKGFSAKDRSLLHENFSNLLHNQSSLSSDYSTNSFEYLRTSLSGRIVWVRTEIKSYIDPYTNHNIVLLLTYESGKHKFPEALLARFISKEVEIISLFNLKAQAGQSYYIYRNYFTIDKIIDDQLEGMRNYAETRIDEESREEFLNTVNINNVIANLNSVNDVYRVSFFARYNAEIRRKTWSFSYIDDECEGLFVTRSDTTASYETERIEKAKLTEALEQIEVSKYDGLTGLYTRSISISKIEEMASKKGSNPRALLMIDLDNLKVLNDTYGHIEGDKALALLSEVLRNNCSDGIIGRVGGDEFVIYFNDISNVNDFEKRLSNLLETIDSVTITQDRRLSCSIGCVIDYDASHNFNWLYRRADRALYGAKNNGKNQYYLYRDAK